MVVDSYILLFIGDICFDLCYIYDFGLFGFELCVLILYGNELFGVLDFEYFFFGWFYEFDLEIFKVIVVLMVV